MKLAFALFKYFPYGGLQRDCIKVAQECIRRGHEVEIYTLEKTGDAPANLAIICLPEKSRINYLKYERFAKDVQERTGQGGYAGLIGFNKMPGLDVYYAADPCFAAKVADRSIIYRMLPRSRSFLAAEKAVFSSLSNTHILMISPAEQKVFQDMYGTASQRMTLLPPGIQKDRLMPAAYDLIRQQKRNQLDIAADSLMLLMVGSGFKTKGVDRSLKAIAALPAEIRKRVILYVIGQDNARPFESMAKRLDLQQQVIFPGGRDDIPELLFAADLLMHPAYRENTGTVLLEAMAAGLPQLVSSVCGYSFYINQAQSGVVLDEPFSQEQMNVVLAKILDGQMTEVWRQNAKRYVATHDIFSMPEKAVDAIEQVLGC